LLTGCWDRQELEERAVVLGVSIDRAEEVTQKKEEEVSHLSRTLPAPKTGMLRITVQIAVPGRIPLGPGQGGGGGGGGGGGIRTVWVVDAVGHTIEEAVNNLQQRVAPPLFLGHLRVIVVSEAVARNGIQNLNDYFHRNPEIRRMNWMFISKGRAEDFMRASPQLERVPTLYFMTTMDKSVKMGRFPDDFLGMFWSASSSKGKEGYLPYIELQGKDTVQISGLAYFRGDKMVGSTKPIEVPLFMGIMGLNPAGGQAFVKVPGTEDYVVWMGKNRKSVIKIQMKDGHPHVAVRVYIEGNLNEKTSDEVLLNREVIQQVEQELAKQTKIAYLDLIRKTQEKGADIFGFGEYVRAKQPRYWNEQVKTKERWQEMYKDLSVDITVQVHVRRVGMKAK
jgi:spore germination protein KC